MGKKIYLDDVRTPKEDIWVVVRNYDEFVETVTNIGLENIDVISLDHDLGEDEAKERVSKGMSKRNARSFKKEAKTGFDCAKWLVDYYLDEEWDTFPQVYTHSANPVGSANIIGYINGFLKSGGMAETCASVRIPHN
jgi:hypothetical protein